MLRFFLYLKVILFASCVANRAILKIGDILNKHIEAFNKLPAYIPHEEVIEDGIDYAKRKLLPDKDNPIGIIDKLFYCNLEAGCSLTPLSRFSDYKSENEKKAVLEYIENVLIINCHLHLKMIHLSGCSLEKDRYDNPVVKKIFKKVNKIALEARRNYEFSKMTFADVMYKALKDTFEYNEYLIQKSSMLGCGLTDSY